MSKPRFLLLSASTGNGHTSAANALRDEFHARGCDAEVINVMDHVVKAFRRWFQGGYEMLVRRGPDVWGLLYRTSDKPYVTYNVQTWLDKYCSYPLDQLIRDYKPDWIINTHSVAQPRLPKLKKEMGFGVSVVVTDLYPHRMWIRGRPDHYFVPNEYSKSVLENRIPYIKGHVDVTGIPINQAFSCPPQKMEARSALHLTDRPAVVITSGGIGAGPFEEVVTKVGGLDLDVLVVCGRSEMALNVVKGVAERLPNVRPLGHVSQAEMAQLMAATDVLVGKSGGLTTFEALSVGCPFVVYLPFLIPGQEEDNAKWLSDHGAGLTVPDLETLLPTLQRLVGAPDERARMSEEAKKLAKPNATQEIVNRMLQLRG